MLSEIEPTPPKIVVKPLGKEDYDQAAQLIDNAINNSFKWEFRHPVSERKGYMPDDIDSYLGIIEDEISKQCRKLKESLDGGVGGRKYFGVRSADGKLQGIMGYDRHISEEIVKALPQLNTSVKKEDLGAEIISAYVAPEFQQQGVARQLLYTILEEFEKEQINLYALFSGYEKGQIAWTRLLKRAPDVSLINHYQDGADAWVWIMTR